MKSICYILPMFLGIICCKGQGILAYPENEVKESYELINLQNSNGLLLDVTVGSDDGFSEMFMTYQWLNENNREPIPGGVLKVTPYVDFDTLLTKNQKDELTLKFKNLPKFTLEQDKINAKIISKIDIEKRNESQERICYGIVSFPIIQEGKDGTLYGIIYEMSDICPVSHPGSNMFVYRKIKGEWEYFCIVNVSV